MRTTRPVRWRELSDGIYIAARTMAGSVVDALAVAADLVANPPADTYPWRIEVQKDPRGARASVIVSFRRRGIPIDGTGKYDGPPSKR